MKIRGSASALAEIHEARRWYRQRSPDAEQGLRAAYKVTRPFVSRNPRAGSPVDGNVRRAWLSSYPYCLIYEIRETEVVIVAFAHAAENQSTGAGERASEPRLDPGACGVAPFAAPLPFAVN